MGKKRKASSTAPLVAPPMTSRRVARQVTSKFHKLTSDLATSTSSAARAELARELEGMGGRARYQEASALSTSLYSTSKWVLKVLRRRGVVGGGGAAPRLLEVGAINTQLLDAPGVETRAIDLRSTHERVERVDFLDLAPAGAWDVVVCALVLNCVPSPRDRGRAVANLAAHLKPAGLCFVVLPLTCLERSSKTTPGAFDAALAAAGLRELERRATPKLLHLCLERSDAPDPRPAAPAAGAELRPRRKKTNDFHVVLPGAAAPTAATRRTRT